MSVVPTCPTVPPSPMYHLESAVPSVLVVLWNKWMPSDLLVLQETKEVQVNQEDPDTADHLEKPVSQVFLECPDPQDPSRTFSPS